jgi:hypothetical protein
MFRDRYQAGFLNLFNSIGAKPLSTWDQHVENSSTAQSPTRRRNCEHERHL